ncbi:MAG: cobalamin biosynthesis protein CobD [Nitrospinae bacterium]|nr:cobalamin biosynthesis protein CobD [Nitrospinota bacterium]
MHAFAIGLGYFLDLLLKDPHTAWHPVRLIGNFISAQERFYRGILKLELAGGLLLAIITPGAVFFLSLAMLIALERIHWSLAFIGDAVLVWCAISPSALAAEARVIEKRLEAGDDAGAKTALSMIVGRDTAHMDRAAIARATVETVAENSVDGVISPLLYAALGGGPLAMAYRAVNTCDSMVGYRNERYERFGKIPARVDDFANFIPARAALAVIAVAAWLAGLNPQKAVVIGWRDRLKHPSPNSAHGEAAFAGALGVRLGGPSVYGGIVKEKPWLGDEIKPMDELVIAQARRLLGWTALVAALCAGGVSLFLF